MKSRASLFLLAVAALAACGPKPANSVYFNRGGPEMLLDVSSEVVNLSVADPQALQELSTWIRGDQPTRAELYCNEGDIRCNEARKVLDLNGVPTMTVPSGEYTVALVYERILARDCKQRFIDNSHNSWNTSPPSYGCSVAANMVQHVSDKQQFINPNITDVPMSTGAVQAYGRAYAPKQGTTEQPYDVNRSLTGAAETQ